VAAEDIPAPRASMAARLVIMRRLSRSSRTTSFQKNTALLTPIRRRRRQRTRHWRKTPFLDISFDKHEPRLPEVDVHGAGPVRADGGEEVLRFEAVGDVVEFLAVAGEEEGSGAGAVADADDVALHVGGAVGGGGEGLVVAALAGGGVGYGVFVPAWEVVSCWT
jgi:hypothetical protein